MKKLVFGCAMLAAFSLASCSPSKEKIKKEFITSCKDGADKQVPNEQAKKIFHEYCECAGEKVADKYSVKELEEFNQLQKKPDPVKQQELQQKLMVVIQPCLTEMQQKLTTLAPAGGAQSAPAPSAPPATK